MKDLTSNLTTKILWAVYIGLLAVLLPHTAWLFAMFESTATTNILGFAVDLGDVTAWAGAFAFEAAIAVLTHKLAKHIENGPKRYPVGPKGLAEWPKFKYRYLNAFSLGLVVAVAVSALANLAHSVEFGRSLAIFARWGIEPKVYQMAFGGVLPIVSLLFARVLSNVAETEDAPNPELEELRRVFAEWKAKAKETEQNLRSVIAEWQGKAAEAEQRAMEAEQQAHDAETRFAAAGELFARLFNEEKRQRIIAARQTWPELPISAIAIIAASSPSYVSEVLSAEKQ